MMDYVVADNLYDIGNQEIELVEDDFYIEDNPDDIGNEEVEVVEDDDIIEEEEIAKGDIELLRSQVLSNIHTISRWIFAVHTNAKIDSKWKNTFKRKRIPESVSGKFKNNPELPVSDKSLPPKVEINPRVEASFQSLDECLLQASNLSGKNGDKLVQAIVDRVAQMPSLMKTVLLLHKKVDRRRILSHKIVKRVMFSSFSVMPEDYLPMHSDTAKEKVKPEDAETRVSLDSSNSEVPTITLTDSFLSSMSGEFSTTSRTKTKTSWIVNMLKSGNGPMKESVVDYLELLSNQTVVDYILDEDANPTTVDIEMFELSREDIFSEVENLNYLVTAMIFLEDSEKERISITRIIRRVLDNAIVQPFGITILFCDLMFHIFILFGWRSVTFRLIDIAVTGNKDDDQPERGQMLLQSLFFISTLYFLWRLIGEVFSTLMCSWRVFRINFLTPWTIVDVVSIIMSAVCFGLLTANLRVFCEEWFSFFAILTGFLWIKLLSFLKVVNLTLATFVLAIGQVLNDVAVRVLIIALAI
mmetsp:Transcript_2836/g.4025  ORF Transcript_2836/g.4025 Transcript_2836/m.4025 type:complete len:527 (-) Transcript_2836:1130-2710(-)